MLCSRSARRSFSSSRPIKKRTSAPRCGQVLRSAESSQGATRLCAPPQLKPILKSVKPSIKASVCACVKAALKTTENSPPEPLKSRFQCACPPQSGSAGCSTFSISERIFSQCAIASALRYAAHGRSALAIAQWLKMRSEIEKVLHPALPDCGGHAHWKRDFSGSGGLFSVVFNAAFTQAQTDAFIEGLTLFKIGFSWGGAHSLVAPYELSAERNTWPHRGALVRFFIGLEEENDLRADLEHSMARHLTA